MKRRHFSETDLRAMLDDAREYVPDPAPSRWKVRTALHAKRWEIIVEPDFGSQILVVVTAYEVE